ncbi:MAG TPA: tRNA lysidine(34) synthetase TilS [Burkholderiales bacterium]|nr:tRNA lysidine(34) synthetase TilS [Burkholderiales bacterium]
MRVGLELARLVPRGARLTLALSGGIDSIALLDILAALAPRHPFALDCLHVDHGISPNAPAWARFARAAAKPYRIRCTVKRADLAPHRALGLEGAARAARYALFAALRADFVVLAQHEDDQAETVLLQLVRGAGPAGLAAMPSVRTQSARARGTAPRVLRPLLGAARAEISAYARGRDLEWVEDESNADTRRARNLVRHRVLPLLREINPQAGPNLARSAALLAEANEVLQAVAADDAASGASDGRLAVAALAALPTARARNALRWVLARSGFPAPDSARLDEALRQLVEARADASVRIDLGSAEIRRFRGQVWVVKHAQGVPPGFRAQWPGGSTWRVPELGGVLRLKRATGRGLAASAVRPGGLEIRLRQGGERFRPDPRRPQRELKALLQETGVPTWERERLPLLYCGGRLAWIPGIGVAAALRAGRDEAGIMPFWERRDENR